MISKKWFYIFFLPTLIILLALSIYTMAGVVGLSFNKVNLLKPGISGFTWQNYSKLLSDRRFLNAIRVSFTWSAATTLGSMVVGLVLALFLFRRFGKRLENVVSILLIIPIVLSRVGVAQAWKLLYRSFGPFNYVLEAVGMKGVNFLGDPGFAFTSVVIVDIWQWCFFVAFLVLSLMNSVPANYFEEAMVEGASTWRIHWSVSIPMISRGLVAIFFIKFVESLRTVDLIMNITKGGPGTATEMLDLYALYQGIITSGKISYAASMSVIMLVLSMAVLIILWRFLWGKSAKA